MSIKNQVSESVQKTPNKLKEADFIAACQGEQRIKELIEGGYISESAINKELLREHNIRPSFDGLYRKSQIFDLATKISEDLKQKYGGNLQSRKPDLRFQFILQIDTEAPEVRRFLMVTLSEKFQKDVRKIRRRYGIPIRGFNFNQEGNPTEEVIAWRDKSKKQTSKAKNELTEKKKKAINQELGVIFDEESEEVSKNIYWGPRGEATYMTKVLAKKYGISERIANCYITGGFSNRLTVVELRSSAKYRDIDDTFPIATTERRFTAKRIGRKFKTVAIWQRPPVDNYAIAFSRPVGKGELLDYIEKNWPRIKRQSNEFFNHFPLGESFEKNWLVFAYKKLGKTYKEIRVILKVDYELGDFSEDNLKNSVRRMKTYIKKLNSQLPKETVTIRQ